jgi:hypothetical protein
MLPEIDEVMKANPKRKGETIGAYLDRVLPFTCYLCDAPMLRSTPGPMVCKRCGLDQHEPDAYTIARAKGLTFCQQLLKAR